jgi:hypothetical protein
LLNEGTVLSVESGYGAHTRLPYVEVSVGSEVVQMRVEDARALALNLLAAAEAALSDAFLIEFSQGVGMSLQDAGGLLFEFRQWRRDHDIVPGHERGKE